MAQSPLPQCESNLPGLPGLPDKLHLGGQPASVCLHSRLCSCAAGDVQQKLGQVTGKQESAWSTEGAYRGGPASWDLSVGCGIHDHVPEPHNPAFGRVELDELPALPLLAHLILEDLCMRPALVASLRGLASLETLYMSTEVWTLRDTVCDLRACSKLRRVAMLRAMATGLAAAGQDLRLPPACSAALDIIYNIDLLLWLVQLGGRLGKLHLLCTDTDMAAVRTNLWCAPQLVQLRHVTLNVSPASPGSLSVADLLGDLPGRVESLHLDCDDLPSEQADVVVPASLRALRVKAVCRKLVCRRGCWCPRSQQRSVLTFGLHAGLERLCLVLWESCVDLQYLDAGAPTGMRELVVQARVVEMDSHLAAEVAQRGRMLERCDVVDEKWGSGGSVVPDVQVVHMGHGPVQMEYRYATGRLWHWPCTCGACAECLGPEAFGGAMDACG